MKILVINCGSSSIKYKLFAMPQEHLLSKGLIEHIGEAGSRIDDHYTGLRIILEKIDGSMVRLRSPSTLSGIEVSTSLTIDPERSRRVDSVSAIGHRVVHGAERFQKPVLINSSVIKKIRQCSGIAPLHNPANLAGIYACKKLLPDIKQVAVFDTAFHQTLPDYAYIYGLPYEYYKKFGIRKYGFHGTSHEYVAGEAARVLKKPLNKLKIITCHLGNGCSITAVDKSRAVDTSMGFTPLEGLLMGTRCGDIDPALVTYIMRKKGLDIQSMDELLNKASGLKGVSGTSNDMRVLMAKAKMGNKRARLAIDIFVYRIKKYIGAYITVMGGCDAIIFTAGIGENQNRIRDRVIRGLFAHLRKEPKVLVISTDEELMIARKTYKLIKGGDK